MKGFKSRLTVLERQLRTLPDKPEETPESTLRALWLTSSGSPMSAVRSLAVEMPVLDTQQIEFLDRLIARRLHGEPLGHLTGRQTFMGIELTVSGDALLPRQETEILGHAAHGVARELLRDREELLVVDTCCGCGNVAFAVACEFPLARVIGVDLSEDAVRLAESNSRGLGVDQRVSFRVGDLLQPVEDLAGHVDLITCNPPYISTATVREMNEEIASHEPALAFDGGPFGVKILRRLIKQAPAVLRRGGYLAFEVGLGQGEPMMSQLEKLDAYLSVESHRDSDGAIRAIVSRLR